MAVGRAGGGIKKLRNFSDGKQTRHQVLRAVVAVVVVAVIIVEVVVFFVFKAVAVVVGVVVVIVLVAVVLVILVLFVIAVVVGTVILDASVVFATDAVIVIMFTQASMLTWFRPRG